MQQEDLDDRFLQPERTTPLTMAEVSILARILTREEFTVVMELQPPEWITEQRERMQREREEMRTVH